MNPFRRTGNIALQVDDLEAAIRFYRDTLQLPVEKEGKEDILFKTESGLFYITRNPEWQGIVEEYEVEDVGTARRFLENAGCRVLRWQGKGGDCYMEDPFGMKFNLWERTQE